MDRRSFLSLGAAVAGGAVISRASPAAAQGAGPAARLAGNAAALRAPDAARPPPAIVAPAGQLAVVTPNGSTLPWRIVGGVKVGHLVAAPLDHEIAPGLRVACWGYNGSTPGPTLEAVEGDRLRLYVTNRLPEPTTVHWHGVILQNGMDGVSGLTQRPIPPGETFVYEFVVRYPGTYMYHPHFDEMTQMALGMHGMFVVHPQRPRGPKVDRDFVLMTHEWKLPVGTSRPDPNEMTDFNVLTFNSKAFPATEPLLVGRGERVRIRLGNLSAMEHHPIHLHGAHFQVTATDGGYVPESAQKPETTVLVPVGSTRVIELVPEEPGDWPLHCHMTHHVMMQMGHGLPNMIGVRTDLVDHRMSRVLPQYMTMGTSGMGGMGDMAMAMPPNSRPMRGGPGPFGTIEMGGMFTVLKVRDRPTPADAAGWYRHPEGTVADFADPAAMERDGIDTAREV